MSPVFLSAILSKPPNMRKVERVFSKNQAEFCIVTNFLNEHDAQSIIISSPDGIMQANFAKCRILDQDVLETLEVLFSLRSDMSIFKSNDSIQFCYWTHWIADIGSYVAYSENQKRDPNIQFATQIIPMESIGWYYVISDYDQWRIEN